MIILAKIRHNWLFFGILNSYPALSNRNKAQHTFDTLQNIDWSVEGVFRLQFCITNRNEAFGQI